MNQNSEQIAREIIDVQVAASVGAVQGRTATDFHPGEGQAIRECATDTDSAAPKGAG